MLELCMMHSFIFDWMFLHEMCNLVALQMQQHYTWVWDFSTRNLYPFFPQNTQMCLLGPTWPPLHNNISLWLFSCFAHMWAWTLHWFSWEPSLCIFMCKPFHLALKKQLLFIFTGCMVSPSACVNAGEMISTKNEVQLQFFNHLWCWNAYARCV